MESKQLIAEFENALLRCGWHRFYKAGKQAFMKPVGFVGLFANLDHTAQADDPVFRLACLIVSSDFDQNSLAEWRRFEAMESTLFRACDLNLKNRAQDIKDSLFDTDRKYHKSWEWEIKSCELELIRNMEAPVISKVQPIGKRWLIDVIEGC